MKFDVVNHRLKLSYKEFQDIGQDLSQTTIGNYSVSGQLGEGGFGKVYKGMNEQTKQIVAIKVIDIAKIHQEHSQKLKSIKLQLVRRQDIMMRICDSPNLIKCYDVYENQSLKLMMIQYCNGGNLQEYIEKKGRIAEKEAILIFKQILNGIAGLHSRMVIHRDLKSQNIMIHNGIFKIADFGFSKQLEQDNVFKGTTLGTITNMAPEVMKRQPYGLKADVWSVGIILFQMVFGDFPFSSREKISLLDQIDGSNIYKQNRIKFNGYTATVQMSNFLRRTISVDQKDRFGWKQLMTHPILKQNDEQEKVPRSQVVNVPLVAPPTLQAESNILRQNFSSFIKRFNVVFKDSQKIVLKNKNKPNTLQNKQNQAKNAPLQDQIYKQMNEYLVECLKIQLIYGQIIQKIENHKMLDLDERPCIQLMYLLTTRCFLSISPIHYFMSQKDKTNLFINQTYPIIHKLYQKVKNLFSKYQKLLTEEEDKLGNKISDFFKPKKELEQTNKFMNGIEKLDFQKAEQLAFIQNSYIKKLVKNLKSSGQLKQGVKNYMNIYTKINMIQSEHLQKIDFDNYIKQLL